MKHAPKSKRYGKCAYESSCQCNGHFQFAAAQRLDLLQSTVGPLYLPIEVYQEIQEGQTAGYEFYAGIEQYISPFTPDGWLHLVAMAEDELPLLASLPNRLHLGEAACLCIARQRNSGFLTDDRAARK